MKISMRHTCSMIILSVLSVGSASCAATRSADVMSVRDEARYASAIEAENAKNPPAVNVGDTIVVDAGAGTVQIVPQGAEPAVSDAAVTAAPAEDGVSEDYETRDGRQYTVKRAAYDAFFKQSPAVVLARFELDPIQDGTELLGYRIRSIRKPFDRLDLKVEDIIIGIDGKMPKTPDDYFERWQNAAKNGRCAVNVQRGVDRFDLSWAAR